MCLILYNKQLFKVLIENVKFQRLDLVFLQFEI